MSEIKHTPGPWHVLPLQTIVGEDINDRGSFSIGNSADVDQAIVLCSRFPWAERADEMRANAHLIAAAPSMLAALQDAEKWLVLLEANKISAHGIGVIEKTRAAISKALGSQS